MSHYFEIWCKICDIKSMKYMALPSNGLHFIFETLIVPRAIGQFYPQYVCTCSLHCFSGTSIITLISCHISVIKTKG